MMLIQPQEDRIILKINADFHQQIERFEDIFPDNSQITAYIA